MENQIAPNPKTAYLALHDPAQEELITDVMTSMGYEIIKPPEKLDAYHFKNNYSKQLIEEFIKDYIKADPTVTIMDANYPHPGSPNLEHLNPFLGAYTHYKKNPEGKLFIPVTGHHHVEAELAGRNIEYYSKPLSISDLMQEISELEQKL